MTDTEADGSRWPESPPWSPAWRLWILTVVTVLAAVFWWNVRQFTTIVVSAVLLAYVLDPPIRRLQRRTSLTRPVSALVVYTVLAAAIVVAAILAAPLMAREIMEWDPAALQESTVDAFESLPDELVLLNRTLRLEPLYDQLLVQADRAEEALLGRESMVWLLGFATDFAFTVLGVFFTLVASMYLAMDADNVLRWLERKTPAGYGPAVAALRLEVGAIWQAFFRGQLVLVIGIGVATTLAMAILGVPYALALGVLAGALEVVPRVGPTISVIPAMVIASLQPSATFPALPKPVFLLLVGGAYVLIQQVENNVLVPRVIGSRVRLPPAVVLVGALIGASLAGVIGILLAPPVMGTVRVIGSWLFEKLSGPSQLPPPSAEGEGKVTSTAKSGNDAGGVPPPREAGDTGDGPQGPATVAGRAPIQPRRPDARPDALPIDCPGHVPCPGDVPIRVAATAPGRRPHSVRIDPSAPSALRAGRPSAGRAWATPGGNRMRLFRIELAAAATALVLAILGGAPATAAQASEAVVPPDRLATGAVPDPSVELVLELGDPGLWDLYSAGPSDLAGSVGEPPATLREMDAALQARQAVLATQVTVAGGAVIGRYTAALNALHVSVPRSLVSTMATLPGVTRVRLAPVVSLSLEDAVPLVGAPRAWQELGLDGTGATIAIIDSGVDYTHAALGGPGTLDAHRSNNENIVEPGSFPTEKVIGGWDFAGERYTPGCQPGAGVVCTPTPRPDPDPLDPTATDTGPSGHGTHVSTIAAGIGVGDPSTGGVAPGIAPGASIVALKVFGNPVGIQASTGLSAMAIDWVVRHNLAVLAGDPSMDLEGAPPGIIHILNLSLGSDWGPTLSVFNDVIDRVIASGATVVASAGNDGARPYITGSPAAAEHALSVANSYPPGEFVMYIEGQWRMDGRTRRRADTATPGAVIGQTENGWMQPLPEGGLTGDLALYGLACNVSASDPSPSQPAQDVSGKIALIERGVCPFYDKVWNAEKLGAIGALVYSDARPVTIMGCGAPSDCANGPSIPGVMVELEAGVAWRGIVEDGASPTVTMDGDNQVELTDSIARDSSRGPARASAQIKPQISAPGMQIQAARSGSGDGGVKYGGTSMSGPLVAGVTALLWQRNLDASLGLDPLEIAALAMNYASPSVHITPAAIGGPIAPIARQGAGRVNAYRSAAGDTLVRSATGIAELSFGNVVATKGPSRLSEELRIRNLATAPKTYRLDWRFAQPAEDADRGVSLSVRPDTLIVGGGGSANVDVTLTVDPNRVRQPWLLRGTDAVRDEWRMTLHEVDGWVTVTEVDGAGRPVPDGDDVVVPFHVLPRAGSCAITEPAILGTVDLDGRSDEASTEVVNGCPTEATIETYALLGTDPVEDRLPDKVDVQAVGVAMVKGEDGGDALEFAVRMRGPRRIPQDTDVRIYLDLDRNGSWDRVVFGIEATLLNEQDPEAYGRWIVLHSNVLANLDIGAAGLTPGGYFEPFDIDESVVRYVVSANDPDNGLGIDLSDPNLAFDVAVRVEDRVGDFPQTGEDGLILRDEAPDGWSSRGGPRYTFRMQAVDCLSIGAPDGTVVRPGRGGRFAVAGSDAGAVAIRGCSAPMDPIDAGVLLSYPTNAPQPFAAEVVRVRVAVNRPAIYLPYAAKRHTLIEPAPTVPQPTREATAQPPAEARFVITYLQCAGPNEFVRIENTGRGSGNLAGWSVVSAVGDERYVFEARQLAPGQAVSLHSGPEAPPTGEDRIRWTTDVVWADGEDEARLLDPQGQLVDRDGC